MKVSMHMLASVKSISSVDATLFKCYYDGWAYICAVGCSKPSDLVFSERNVAGSAMLLPGASDAGANEREQFSDQAQSVAI